jgi:hypothetical protein
MFYIRNLENVIPLIHRNKITRKLQTQFDRVCTWDKMKNATYLMPPSTGLSGPNFSTLKSFWINDPESSILRFHTFYIAVSKFSITWYQQCTVHAYITLYLPFIYFSILQIFDFVISVQTVYTLCICFIIKTMKMKVFFLLQASFIKIFRHI